MLFVVVVERNSCLHAGHDVRHMSVNFRCLHNSWMENNWAVVHLDSICMPSTSDTWARAARPHTVRVCVCVCTFVLHCTCRVIQLELVVMCVSGQQFFVCGLPCVRSHKSDCGCNSTCRPSPKSNAIVISSVCILRLCRMSCLWSLAT